MKNCTDLPQSKILAKFLPIESADMFYNPRPSNEIPYVGNANIALLQVPCWSLTALLGVLPFHLIVNNQRYAFSMHKGLNKDGETYVLRYNVFNTDVCLYTTDYYNNPVDACVAMVEKLHELNLL